MYSKTPKTEASFHENGIFLNYKLFRTEISSYSRFRKHIRVVWMFVKQLCWPFVFGLLTLLGQYLVQNFQNKSAMFRWPSESEWMYSVISAFIVFIVILSKERAGELAESLELLGLFEITNAHRWLANAHARLPVKLRFFLSEKLDEGEKNGGGIVILKVHDDNYLEWLKECLNHAQESYESILTNPYPPKWFFNDDSMKSNKKLEFLAAVENHPNRDLKMKRLLVFKRSELQICFTDPDLLPEDQKKKGMKPDEIKKFFNYHERVQLYFVDYEKLIEKSTWYQKVMLAITHDYALIDKQLVLKRNGKFELSFCIGNTDEFQGIFDTKNWNRDIVKSRNEIINEFNLQEIVSK